MTRELRRVELTYPVLMAASWDAGNRAMRAAGREQWNADDWNVAAAEAERLRPYLTPNSEASTQ